MEFQPGDFTSTVARQIYDACASLADDEDQLDFGRLLANFDDPAVKTLIVDLDESSAAKASADRERWWQDLIVSAQTRRNAQQNKQATAKAESDPAEIERLAAQFFQASRSKNLSEYERRKK